MNTLDVTVVLVALATLCTLIIIGLGFLPFPGRAISIWSGAFAAAMVSSYLLVAADVLESSLLRALAHGPILCAVALLWVGLRARRGVEPIFLVPTILVFCVLTAGLVLLADTEWYGLLYRVIFVVAAVGSVLSAIELARIEKPLRGLVMPLVVAALGFAVLSISFVIDAIISSLSGSLTRTEPSLLPLLPFNELVASVYLVCALVTLLTLARGGDAKVRTRETVDFAAVAQERLDRAQAAGDRWWSLLDVRLDDPAELLEASSGRAFDRVTTRFAEDIRAIMPPEADIHGVSPTQVLVLLPRPDTAVRGLLSRLLERIATVTDQQAVPVRLSASIGVAAAPLADYDLGRLRASAADAAEHAQISGGDRWERAVFAS